MGRPVYKETREVSTSIDQPCIERRGLGFSEVVSFREFAEHIIQDWDMAVEVATAMLKSDSKYPWNEDNKPEFYEEFYPSDREILRAALKAQEHAAP
jgi:hypothetical protein